MGRAHLFTSKMMFLSAPPASLVKEYALAAGSVIAAGSVVVKSVPANEIWGDNPAKFIKRIEQ